MAVTPGASDFVISQGDSLPIMRIPIPANSANELLDLAGCTVTFLGRKHGTNTYPPPIIRLIESYAQETEDGEDVIAVYVHLTDDDTKAISVANGQTYTEMEGELEIVDGNGDVLTVPSLSYIEWYIRDDIGDGAA